MPSLPAAQHEGCQCAHCSGIPALTTKAPGPSSQQSPACTRVHSLRQSWWGLCSCSSYSPTMPNSTAAVCSGCDCPGGGACCSGRDWLPPRPHILHAHCLAGVAGRREAAALLNPACLRLCHEGTCRHHMGDWCVFTCACGRHTAPAESRPHARALHATAKAQVNALLHDVPCPLPGRKQGRGAGPCSSTGAPSTCIQSTLGPCQGLVSSRGCWAARQLVLLDYMNQKWLPWAGAHMYVWCVNPRACWNICPHGLHPSKHVLTWQTPWTAGLPLVSALTAPCLRMWPIMLGQGLLLWLWLKDERVSLIAGS